ncbi:MAG: class I SAM-dependent DNA methyltransferase [Acidimicrobiales bacterium]
MSSDFDERAATWDDDPAKVERARVVADAIRAAVPLDPSMRMLEYGAGTGLVTEALQDSVGPVTLADTSAGMREQMERKVDAGLLRDARVVELDLSGGAPPGERFDLIVTVMVLHHITPLEPVLDAFATLLAEGGYLCVVDLEEEDGSFHGEGFHGHHGFAPADLTAWLERAGFSEVSVSRCYEIERGDGTYPLILATAHV